MSTTQNGAGPRSANAGDCARLWRTLTDEYISGLRLELEPRTDMVGQTSIWVSVVDDSLHSIDGKQMVNVWAIKDFRNPLYLISVGQLFELLISAHHRIEAYFSKGESCAPDRRVK